MAEAEPPVPLAMRLAFLVVSTIVAAALAEGAVRVADGNALPNLAIFVADPYIRLQPDASANVLRPDGGAYTLHTDADGLRLPAGNRWLAVGDSQVFGMGVEDGETFAAIDGLWNAGVPGYGVPDAVARAEALLPRLRPDGVLFVVNQANDWDDGLRSAPERWTVRGGWLLTTDGAACDSAWFWSTPFSRSHLMYLAWMRVSLDRSADDACRVGEPPAHLGLGDAAPLEPTTRGIAALLRDFSARHPETRSVIAFLPADAATSDARARVSPFAPKGTPWADTALKDQLAAALAPTPLLDLTPALRDPDNFLEHDYHLSVAGHRRVAQALQPELR